MGENDQTSSRSVKRPYRPAMAATARLTGRVQYSPCHTAGSDEDRAAEHRRPGPQQQAHQDGGLVGEVGGEEVWHADAHPDAERERHADHRQQPQRLAAAAARQQQQVFEGVGPRQRRRIRPRRRRVPPAA